MVQDGGGLLGTKTSFDEAIGLLHKILGVKMARRPLEAMARQVAPDVEGFYQERERPEEEKGEGVVVVVDGKGLPRRQGTDAVDKVRPKRGEFTLILDIFHVIGYVSKAVHIFHKEGSQEAEEWVRLRLLAILPGRVGYVIRGIKQSLTKRKLKAKQRKVLEVIINYLPRNRLMCGTMNTCKKDSL